MKIGYDRRRIELRSGAAATMLVLALFGCVAAPVAEQAASRSGQHTRLSDRLYFGRAHASGMVSEEQWAAFLAEVVTPRFPDGLTVWAADGQWRDGARHVIVREPTFVLEVVHLGRAPRDADLRAVVDAYKQRFAQHSVLWVRDSVTVIE